MYKVSIFLCAVYLADLIQGTNPLENSYNIKPCNRRSRFEGNSPVSVNGPIVGTIQYPNPFLKPDSLSVNAKSSDLNSLKQNVLPEGKRYDNELQNNNFLKDTDDLSRYNDVTNINKNVDDFPVEEKISLNDLILPEESKTGTLLNGNEDIQEISLRGAINPDDLRDDEKKCLDIEKRIADSNEHTHQNRRMSQGSQNDESDLVDTNNVNQKSLSEPEYDSIYEERMGDVQAADRNAYEAGTKGNRKNSDSVSSFSSPSRNQLLDPARGEGVSSMSETNLLLSQTSQLVCYACSTLSNPTCASPDRKTTVKYCSRGNDACIKKTFQGPDSLITVRDCGSSCKDGPVSALELKYKTCQVCHSDLCNGAYTVQSISLIVILGIIGFSKYAV